MWRVAGSKQSPDADRADNERRSWGWLWEHWESCGASPSHQTRRQHCRDDLQRRGQHLLPSQGPWDTLGRGTRHCPVPPLSSICRDALRPEPGLCRAGLFPPRFVPRGAAEEGGLGGRGGETRLEQTLQKGGLVPADHHEHLLWSERTSQDLGQARGELACTASGHGAVTSPVVPLASAQ